MNKELNIKINIYAPDSNLEVIRDGARAEGYAMTAGLKEFVKIKYNAKLNVGRFGITSITFKDANSKEFKEFKERYEKDMLMFALRKNQSGSFKKFALKEGEIKNGIQR